MISKVQPSQASTYGGLDGGKPLQSYAYSAQGSRLHQPKKTNSLSEFELQGTMIRIKKQHDKNNKFRQQNKMYSLQRMLPGHKANLKPGVFSCHSILSRANGDSFLNTSTTTKTNTTQETVQRSSNQQAINTQALQLLQHQIQQSQKQSPPSKTKSSKSKEKPQRANLSVDPARIIKKTLKSSDKKLTPKAKYALPQPKSGKKLNFSQLMAQNHQKSDSETLLSTCNHIGNIIMENILNKEDHYDKLKSENQELKEAQQQVQKQTIELKRSLNQSEQLTREIKDKLDQERQRYHKELLKFQEKLSIIKTLQSNLQVEKTKSENLSAQLKDQQATIGDSKKFFSNLNQQSLEYLDLVQMAIEHYQKKDYDSAISELVNLIKISLDIVFQLVSQTQKLKIPSSKKCKIEDIDFEQFISLLESLQNLNNLNNIHDAQQQNQQSLQESYIESQELSFRQKTTAPIIQLQNSLPLSQVYNKQSMIPSKNASLQEQFQTFLQDDPEEPPELFANVGSPYFTHHHMPLQMCQPKEHDMHADQGEMQQSKCDLPLQSRKIDQNLRESKQGYFEKDKRNNQLWPCNDKATERLTKIQEQLKDDFHSFNQNTKKMDHLSVVLRNEESNRDQTFYDSLFSDIAQSAIGETKPKPKQNSLHTLNYLDQQVNRSLEVEKQRSSRELTHSTKSTDEMVRQQSLKTMQKVQCHSDKENQIQKSVHCNKHAIAIHNFQAVKSDNISFSKGDKIVIYKMNKNGWWLGLCNGQQGYFPHNYVLIQED